VDVEKILDAIRGKKIVADGDFDGVTASILLAHVLGPVEVEYPHPRDTAKRSNAVVIERPERAGENCVVIDHHAEGNEGYIILPDGAKIVFGPKPSVARLVRDIVGEVPEKLEELVKYADIIDSTPPHMVAGKLREAGLDPDIYFGYRFAIPDPSWRQRVASLLRDGKAVEAGSMMLTLFKKLAPVAKEVVPKKAEEIASTAKVIETPLGRIAVFPVEYGKDYIDVEGVKIDLVQAAMKPAQGVVEKKYPDVVAVVTYIISPQGSAISVSSPRGLANKIVLAIKEMGLAESAGGRPNVAGAQGLKFEYTELERVLTQVAEKLAGESKERETETATA